jgi:hypothetical protein
MPFLGTRMAAPLKLIELAVASTSDERTSFRASYLSRFFPECRDGGRKYFQSSASAASAKETAQFGQLKMIMLGIGPAFGVRLKSRIGLAQLGQWGCTSRVIGFSSQ